jgi:hypothetical protein
MRNLHKKIPEVGYPPLCQRRGQVMSIFGCNENLLNNMNMFNLKCLHVLTNNVDGKLKVKLGLGQLMKFTYHPVVKSSVD